MNRDPQDIANRLADWGYEFSHEVAERGEASLRGGLLDVWPLAAEHPVRIEFFGDVIDSIRTFDPLEQTPCKKFTAFSSPRLRRRMRRQSVFLTIFLSRSTGDCSTRRILRTADLILMAEIREQTEEGASFLSVEAVLQPSATAGESAFLWRTALDPARH